MKRRCCAILALAAALALLAGCSGQSANVPKAPPPPDVLVTPVIQQNVPVYGDWVATLDGYVNANIQPQVSGYLIRQNYREGSLVHKDEVLFEIDPRPFQADARSGQRGSSRRRAGSWRRPQAQLGARQ